jgi:Ca-activated chloride channel family protein
VSVSWRLATCTPLLTAAVLAADSLPPGPASARAAQTPVFRAGVDLVHFAVTVTDATSALVTGLTAEDFAVYEDGKEQAIQYFVAGDGIDSSAPPLHLGLMLDVSESMVDRIDFTRTASVRFLNALQDALDVTVVDFDTEVRVARFGQNDFARVVERIRQQKVRGWTALYDAIGLYLDGASGLDGRKVMLLYTDGGDTTSALSLRELLDLVKASDVTIYAIGAMDQRVRAPRGDMRRVLDQITRTSGGAAFYPDDSEDLDRIYDQVVAEIRAQYTIGYISSHTAADGAWRKVEIKLRDPQKRRVRARAGYYAPYRP